MGSIASKAIIPGAVAGVAAGGAIVGATWKEKGAVLPGTEYVGPGNPINIDAPRHGFDAVAKDHDIGYKNLLEKYRTVGGTDTQFKKEVSALDSEAARAFWQDYNTYGNWQSFVGHYGLRIKQADLS